MVETYRHTVDVEYDWGGRTSGTQGITEGLPIILEVFRANKIKALFFISSELAMTNRGSINRIVEHGHEIGSHGHFHIKYADKWRADQDKEISERLLSIFTDKKMEYRAPWFSNKSESVYSDRKNHVSILKKVWFNQRIPDDPIFYIHPFDIVHWKKAPHPALAMLYGRPDDVLDTFKRYCRLYPHSPKAKAH